MENPVYERQGDLMFVEEGSAEGFNMNGVSVLVIPDGAILKGTTHVHRLADPNSAYLITRTWTNSVDLVVTGPEPVVVEHVPGDDCHKPITLKPNTVYRVKRARENDFASGAMRYVVD